MMNNNPKNNTKPKLPPFDRAAFKRGIALMESSGGKNLWNKGKNLKSDDDDALGKYQILYKYIKNLPEMKDVSIKEFIANDSLQEKVMDMVIDNKIPGFPGMDKNAKDLTSIYKPLFGKNWNLRPDEVAAISYYVGRGGAKKYFRNLLNNKKYKVANEGIKGPGTNVSLDHYMKVYNKGFNEKKVIPIPTPASKQSELSFRSKLNEFLTMEQARDTTNPEQFHTKPTQRTEFLGPLQLEPRPEPKPNQLSEPRETITSLTQAEWIQQYLGNNEFADGGQLGGPVDPPQKYKKKNPLDSFTTYPGLDNPDNQIFRVLSKGLDRYESALRNLINKPSFTSITANLGFDGSKRSMEEYNSQLEEIPDVRKKLISDHKKYKFSEKYKKFNNARNSSYSKQSENMYAYGGELDGPVDPPTQAQDTTTTRLGEVTIKSKLSNKAKIKAYRDSLNLYNHSLNVIIDEDYISRRNKKLEDDFINKNENPEYLTNTSENSSINWKNFKTDLSSIKKMSKVEAEKKYNELIQAHKEKYKKWKLKNTKDGAYLTKKDSRSDYLFKRPINKKYLKNNKIQPSIFHPGWDTMYGTSSDLEQYNASYKEGARGYYKKPIKPNISNIESRNTGLHKMEDTPESKLLDTTKLPPARDSWEYHRYFQNGNEEYGHADEKEMSDLLNYSNHIKKLKNNKYRLTIDGDEFAYGGELDGPGKPVTQTKDNIPTIDINGKIAAFRKHEAEINNMKSQYNVDHNTALQMLEGIRKNNNYSPPTVSQDNRTEEEYFQSIIDADKINKDTIPLGQQPLKYLAEPMTFFGDKLKSFQDATGFKHNPFPTTSPEEMARLNNANLRGTKAKFDLAMSDYIVPATINTAASLAFMPEANSILGGVKSFANELVNPLAGIKLKGKKKIIGEISTDNFDENVIRGAFTINTRDLHKMMNKHEASFRKKYGKHYSNEDIGLYSKIKEIKNLRKNRNNAPYLTKQLQKVNENFINKHNISTEYKLIEDLLFDVYTRGYDTKINKRPFSNRISSAKFYEKEVIPELEKLIKKNKLESETLLSRGVRDYPISNIWRNNKKLDGGLPYKDLKLGDEFETNSFVSTSTDAHYDSSWGTPNLKTEIIAPKGQSIGYPNASATKFHDLENEVILPQNLRFKVTKVNPPNKLTYDIGEAKDIPKEYLKKYGFVSKPETLKYNDGTIHHFTSFKKGEYTYGEDSIIKLYNDSLKHLKKPKFVLKIMNPYAAIPLIMATQFKNTSLLKQDKNKQDGQ